MAIDPTPDELFATYESAFSELPGFLNFASYGPPSTKVRDHVAHLMGIAGEAGPDAVELLFAEEVRAREAFSRLSGFPLDQVGLTGSTSLGLFQVAFGLSRGTVLVSAGEFPSNTYPWLRNSEAGRARVELIGEPGTQVTPDVVARGLTADTVAVSVSAVDFRTGYVADLAGIREVIGPDRLLVVDGIQGFGVADLEWTLADALIAGAQKWVRGGWGMAGLAVSEQGLERIEPLLTGWTGGAGAHRYNGEGPPPLPGAGRFSVSNLSPYATGSFAEALELVETVGVQALQGLVATHAGALIDHLDAAGVTVLSPRERDRRAGIVVAGVPGRAAEAREALAAAGITVTRHGEDRIRFAVHATTRSEVLGEAAAVVAAFT
ncbi:aminotransferase class V-fold PLP-dependent enzyme [Arthrobacter sp. RIT-PI-e]|uniref:aminotransferase class V-fold PLP-dependent enzyme n=1 Tax=Arthrobacter sp. RIT-PI-e TaxID=1681197 RepID=UPI000676911A|nr:aminotransferase class V-fold PLP-dependent enzyme [Arthrobacter sp. RIT-PI-e]